MQQMTFEQLYRRYFADVHRFSLWLTRDPSEADDVTSETFVRAWARRGRLRTETVKAYLLAIARNVSHDRRRTARRHEELSPQLEDGAPDPLRRAVARSQLDVVTSALGELPELDRTALVLRSELDLPYAEIARVLSISEGAARVKVHRARRRLLGLATPPNGARHEH
jgi:RNA polymerase sigma-70 factor (ECF subfamily)